MTTKFKHITSAKITSLALVQLIADPNNARKTRSGKPAKDMIASIKDKGLLQPLSVIPHPELEDKYIVKIGNRRLTALTALAESGYIDPQAKNIRCQTLNGDDNEILEAQLAENMVRKAMNPVDEFEAFAKLSEQGVTTDEISTRFGTPIRTIKARLALGSCAQVIRDALRTEDISLDAATAYAGCPDIERQIRIFNMFQERGYGGNNYHAVRNALKEERISTTDSIAKFIDIDEYTKRGGEIEQDLIDDYGTFSNSELVYTLRDERLQAEMTKMSEEGWSFVEVHEHGNYDYNLYTREDGEISPLNAKETKQLQKLTDELNSLETKYQESDDDWTDQDIEVSDKLEDQIRELANRENLYTDEQKASGGVFISLGNDGTIRFVKGLVKKGTKKSGAASSDTDAENDNPAPKKRFTDSLKSDLASYRGLGIRAALIEHPEQAEDYMIFSILQGAYAGSWHTNNSVFGKTSEPSDNLPGINTLPSTKTRQKAADSVKSDIFDQNDVYGSWTRFLKLTPKQRAALIANAFSRTIHDVFGQDECSSQIVADLDVSLREYWTPNFETYFSRIRKDQIFEAIVELVGGETAATITRSNSLKKGEIAKLACEIVSGKYPVEPDRKAIVAAWIPQDLEFTKNPASRASVTKRKKAA